MKHEVRYSRAGLENRPAMIWDKTDVIHHLADVHGYRSYLEICSCGTGGRYAGINRGLFGTCRRFMYNCPDDHADGLPIDVRATGLAIDAQAAELRASGARYDVILVDGYHGYDTSRRDLALALDLLAEGGTIVVHDCFPDAIEVATPEPGPSWPTGEWSGVTFMAFVDLVLSRGDLDHRTVDVDFGCGLLRRRTGGARPELSNETREGWRRLGDDAAAAFAFLHAHARELLNLVSLEEFVVGEGGAAKDHPRTSSIVLAMIVKNEAHVIERCLASVRPLVTSWVVVDTGSTDGTQDLVRRAMTGIPGEVFDRPWRGFGASRTEAFDLARGRADYALVIDADDQLEVAPGFALPRLDQDAYSLEVQLGTTRYQRPQLFRLAKPWCYVGVLHEAAHCPEPASRAFLEGVVYKCNRDGARSQDPDKYRRDAEALERALEDEPDNARYVFYAAQSWRDARVDARALSLYRRRVAMGGFDEEVFVALLEVAKAAERLEEGPDVVTGAYLRAHESRPTRAEPLFELARYHRGRRAFALAYLFADAARKIPAPEGDVLFVESDVYAWRVLDEVAIAAYWTGRYEIARDVNERLLHDRRVPEAQLTRIRENLGWTKRALAERSGGPARD